jgi:hypothetical protein
VTQNRRAAGARVWALGLACAVALAACGDGPASTARPSAPPDGPATTTAASTSSGGGAATQPIPSTSPGPSSAPTTLACNGTGVAFPFAALGTFAELLPLTPQGRALAAYVGTAAGAELGLPRDGWHRASLTPAKATFVASSSHGWAFATVALQADGSWAFDEGGSCDLTARAPAGLGFAVWRPDPSAKPAADATRLWVLGREAACANGQAPGPRLLTPIVDESSTTVTVTLLVERLPNADCQGNPWFPLDVMLSSPVGSRALLDGSTYPPTPRG